MDSELDDLGFKTEIAIDCDTLKKAQRKGEEEKKQLLYLSKKETHSSSISKLPKQSFSAFFSSIGAMI